HRRLTQRGRQLSHGADDVRVGDHRAHHFHQLEHRCGIEEMHPDDPIWSLCPHRQLRDRQARGVGRQHDIAAHDPVQLAEDLALEVQPLRHRLDDELHVGQVGELGGEADPAEQLAASRLVELAAFQGTSGGVLEMPATPGYAVVVHLHCHHVVPGAGQHLGDTGTHRAHAHHADRLDLSHLVPSALTTYKGPVKDPDKP